MPCSVLVVSKQSKTLKIVFLKKSKTSNGVRSRVELSGSQVSKLIEPGCRYLIIRYLGRFTNVKVTSIQQSLKLEEPDA